MNEETKRFFVSTATALLALIAVMSVFSGGALAADHEMNGTGTQDDPYVITNAEELQAIEDDLSAHYVLGNDIDASETEEWNK